jgi:hypothetical protein
MLKKTKNLFDRLNSGYYNYLLFSLCILFALRPYEKGILYVGLWKSFFTLTILTAIFNCKHNPWVKKAAIVFAIPALGLTWLELFYPAESLFITSIACTIGFMWICTTSILYDVVLRARVTLETLRGVVCAYFMIAFVFAYMYYLIENLIPGSFHLVYRDSSFITFSRDFSQMLYFSFVTLLTIGFGDVTPLLDLSQTMVVLEGIIGQFYVAILVARIVSVYSFYSDKRLLKNLEKDLKKKKL